MDAAVAEASLALCEEPLWHDFVGRQSKRFDSTGVDRGAGATSRRTGTPEPVKIDVNCRFSALVSSFILCDLKEPRTVWGARKGRFETRGRDVKKVALALVLVVAGLSLGGCFVGKGKAPAPVVTKG